MTVSRSRLALWFVALLLCSWLTLRGRLPAERTGGAPFLHRSDGKVTVRLSGKFPNPGVYRFPAGTSYQTVIKMTVSGCPTSFSLRGGRGSLVGAGDVLTLTTFPRQRAELSVSTMGAKERMLLGVPLDPDAMGEEEWGALPGIGPVLARRIVADRQSNGAFGSVDALIRVPGIGPGKLSRIRSYF